MIVFLIYVCTLCVKVEAEISENKYGTDIGIGTYNFSKRCDQVLYTSPPDLDSMLKVLLGRVVSAQKSNFLWQHSARGRVKIIADEKL